MSGFPKTTLTFLKGLGEHNEKAWFEAHRADYETGYVTPARAFVEELGPRLREVAPEVQFDPKINGSIGRINRDIRFSNDKRPYKDHLDLWFWHGDKKGWNKPGFYLHIAPSAVWLGTGMHMFEKDMLAKFRDAALAERSGGTLYAVRAKLEKAGYTLGSKTRKQPPRGYDSTGPHAEFLLFEGLHAGVELPASVATKADFADVCLTHFRAIWPIGQWINDELA